MDRKQIVAAVFILALCLALAAVRRMPPEASETAASAPLSGLTIALDPGHGGYDQGCQGASGTLEAPLNLDVSLRLRAVLRDMGARVVMTREEDRSLVDPNASGNRKKQDMALREDVIVGSGADILLSIHMNAYKKPGPAGAQTYYREDSAEGADLAGAIQAAFRALDGRHDQAARCGDYFVLGTCEAAALVECGFLSNPREEALLRTEAYRELLANTIAQGVMGYWAPPEGSVR